MANNIVKMFMAKAKKSLNSSLIGYYNFNTLNSQQFQDSIAPVVKLNCASNVTVQPALIGNGRNTTTNNANAVTNANDTTRKYDMAGTKKFSFSTWVKFTNVSGLKYILALENNPYTANQVGLLTNADNVQFVIRSSSTDYISISTTTTVTTDVWYHIVATYNGNNTTSGMNIYLDGVLQPFTDTSVGTFTETITLPNNFRIFMGGSGTLPNYFLGLQDETGIFNRVLTQEEVTYLYNEGAGVTYPFNI